MGKTVSIIVPVYNSAGTLKKCIDSILSQTCKDIELILVNDASSDNSAAICREYAEKDSRVLFIDKMHEGVSAARNAGLEKVSGDFFMFVDSDDFIDEKTCETAVKEAESSCADIVFFDSVLEGAMNGRDSLVPGKKRAEWTGDEIHVFREVFLYNGKAGIKEANSLVAPWGKFIRSKFSDIRFQKEIDYGEDTCYVAVLLEKVVKVTYINEYFYHYVVNAGSLSKTFDDRFPERYSGHVDFVTRLYKNLVADEALTFYVTWRFYACMSATMRLKCSVKEKKKLVDKAFEKIEVKPVSDRKIIREFPLNLKVAVHSYACRSGILYKICRMVQNMGSFIKTKRKIN